MATTKKKALVYDNAKKVHRELIEGAEAIGAESIALSTDAENKLSVGTDGGLFSSGGNDNPKLLISNDTPNALLVGSDGKLSVPVVSKPKDLISTDASNGIELGSDGKLYAPDTHPDELISSDLGNMLTKSTGDKKLYVGATDISDNAISSDANNSIVKGTDKKLYSKLVTPADLISTLPDNAIYVNTDNKLFSKAVTASSLVSSAANNALKVASDNKLLVNVASGLVIDSSDKVLSTDIVNGIKANISLNYNSTTRVVRLIGKDDTIISSITLPEAELIKSAQVVTDPAGQPAGTYLALVFGTSTGDETIYIDLATLITTYTPADASIAISADNKISAVLDPNSSLELTVNGIAVDNSLLVSTDHGNIITIGADGKIKAVVSDPSGLLASDVEFEAAVATTKAPNVKQVQDKIASVGDNLQSQIESNDDDIASLNTDLAEANRQLDQIKDSLDQYERVNVVPFASATTEFLGELGLPNDQGFDVTVTGSANVSLTPTTIGTKRKQVIKIDDQYSDGTATISHSLEAIDFTDMRTYGGSFAGTSRLDASLGFMGFGVMLNNGATFKRIDVIFKADDSQTYLELDSVDPASLGGNKLMDGNNGNPLVNAYDWFDWEIIIAAGADVGKLYLNGEETTIVCNWVTSTSADNAMVLTSLAAGENRHVTYHDTFRCTRLKENTNKVLSQADFLGFEDVAVHLPRGRFGITLTANTNILGRNLGDTLRIIAQNVGGTVTINGNSKFIVNSSTTNTLPVPAVCEYLATNTIDKSNYYSLQYPYEQLLTQDIDFVDASSTRIPSEKATADAIVEKVGESRNILEQQITNTKTVLEQDIADTKAELEESISHTVIDIVQTVNEDAPSEEKVVSEKGVVLYVADTKREIIQETKHIVISYGVIRRELDYVDDDAIKILAGTTYILQGHTYVAETDTVVAITIDTGVVVGGKDYSLFIVHNGTEFSFVYSLSKVNPLGYTTANSLRIGGFHTLCVSTGILTINAGMDGEHPLSNKAGGSILPASLWDRNHRPRGICLPDGMAYSQKRDCWCDIYLISGTGYDTKSEFGAIHSVNRNFSQFMEDLRAVGKEFLSDEDFVEFSLGSNQQTNILGSKDYNTVGGHLDTDERRMVSIYGIEEMNGYLWQHLKSYSAWGHQSYEANWVTTNTGMGATVHTGVLLAGGDWSHGGSCGSLCRIGYHPRSYADSGIGGRGRCACHVERLNG